MKKEELGFLFWKHTALRGSTAVEREGNHPTGNHFFSSLLHSAIIVPDVSSCVPQVPEDVFLLFCLYVGSSTLQAQGSNTNKH